ncbi:UDP-4-amino-4,6-dideoxy-N-acetyl-beta-L-altrosamine transaminase [Ruegeria pomeroyi]|uniref:UDP-4-amino-4, 6-dideoxy-N-acetyl-beta-L-altrosamine transaminase n=1 Tax=Ruegeria pomeroyi TaxID=89184 RepID=A0A9Q3WSH6_9RHOB|nr:UDP-4-amino-4,6-dideoxy-N-acetyl-beta-L-altrosamine transaminase [Ruegeria pomeroyi]MCE8519051.1 UDP-4-amino-4,6-dideoxy-N-acetyl-beta-L-altrosamine transaminase [Ruegeria pomeroyi]MCE8540162.1 UDP-4-amino-4,6-dideoxy-N-acetyl-beta-L-altrosamine transaminase [Ruegeria pomeroyi]
MIPYGRQWITDEDIASVVDVLTSDFLTQGPAVGRFEDSIKAACNIPHAIAVNSATSALHIACLGLGLEPGKRLWTSPNSFVASSNVGLLCGAEVNFVDIDLDTLCMCPDKLAQALAEAEAAGTLPHIVIPVHFGGQSCDMKAIHALSQKYGFHIIEDASHAIGASYDGGPVGDCRYSDACVFSFHPVKIVTTAEGGVVTTASGDLATRLDLLRSHGVTRQPDLMTREGDGPWYYQQVELGLNYRITDMQAALGASQMTRLTEFVDIRHARAEAYDAAFADMAVRIQKREAENRSALHLYPIHLAEDGPDRAALRRRLFEFLREHGVGVNVHYIPIHTQPYYQGLGFREGQFPNAEHYYAGALSLPLHPQLSDADQAHVIAMVRDGLKEIGQG